MNDRASLILYARALLAQARAFRIREKLRGWDGSYSQPLLDWAGNARREATRNRATAPAESWQGELF